MQLSHAKTVADDLLNQLQPFCEVINIAGSIRREKEVVKDIEIVCIPQKVVNTQTDLFGALVTNDPVIHPEFDRIIKGIGKAIKGHTKGRMMQLEMEPEPGNSATKISLDLFMPKPHDYYRILAIRTGSAEYSKRFIAGQWIKKGWCGTDQGLRKISECFKVAENKWAIRKNFLEHPSLPPVWRSEEEVFRWLGVQYLTPDQRNL